MRILIPMPNMPVGRTSLRTTSARYSSHGCWIFRIGHGYEEPHAHFIARFAGLEKDTRAGNADGATQVFKVILLWIGRTDAHELRNLAAAARAALPVGNPLCVTSCLELFRHPLVLGQPE